MSPSQRKRKPRSPSADGVVATAAAKTVALDFLLKGGWFALEQAGRLLNEAFALFAAESYSTAVGLALLSREEVAKSRKLFALWVTAHRGQRVTRDHVRAAIEMNHVEKQRHGASSFAIPVDSSTLELLTHGREKEPAKYQDAMRRVNATFQRLLKQAPDKRHQLRLRAFYVDAARDENTWRRPSDIDRREAEDIILDAGNDYWQHSHPGMPGLTSDINALNAALSAWDQKPPLPTAKFRSKIEE